MAFATEFSTSKSPEVFSRVTDFELNSITSVVDNFATANVLNDKYLLIGDLVSTKDSSLMIVGGFDYHPTHYGTARI